VRFRQQRPVAGRGQQCQGTSDDAGQGARRYDGVDEAAGVQVLGELHAVRESAAGERLVDARAEEAEQGAGLGHGDVPQRCPR
jgi:hypothetical protein